MSSEPKNKKKKSPAPPTPPATSTFSSASPLLTSSSPSNTSNLASSLMTASMIAAQSDFTAYKSPAVAKYSIELFGDDVSSNNDSESDDGLIISSNAKSS
mmetsp:Transcript_10002/g.10098  ORF Transcript_10002/g.10098 Transcript_10002/m.10098 type:complete len:100 (-) Transcript_10002:147-446(-)